MHCAYCRECDLVGDLVFSQEGALLTFQTNNIEIVRACQEFFGFELPVLYCPSELKNLKTVFALSPCSLQYNLSPVYCITLIFS